MIDTNYRKLSLSSVALVSLAVLIVMVQLGRAPGAHAAPPIKEVPVSHFGWEVDKTTKGSVCTVESGDECQPGRESSSPGGFAFPSGVAVAPNGHIYVVDKVNHRIQELTATGAFVSMFGWEVDQTTKGNVCTAVSGDTCKAGVGGSLGGQMGNPYGITIDQSTGNVFVQDYSNWRVDEYTSAGAFVLALGDEVDQTTKGSVCTAVSGDTCKAGVQGTPENPKHGAFNFSHEGGILAVGGSEDLLYVGDETRVQEFDSENGEWKGEIPLAAISADEGSRVKTLALDNSCVLHEPALTELTSPTCKEFDPDYGDLYLTYAVEGEANVIHKFDPSGVQVEDGHFPLTLRPAESNSRIGIRGIALDSAGRIAVGEEEPLAAGGFRIFGSLQDGHTGHFITEFSSESLVVNGVAFDRTGHLYAVSEAGTMEVTAYKPVPVAELLAGAVPCGVGGEKETNIAFGCELKGQVDPWGVKETEVWFEWGKTSLLGERTSVQPIGTKGSEGEEELPLVDVATSVEGLQPNATYYYRLAAYDQNVKAPEAPLSSEITSFATPFVAPKIVGPPEVSFIQPTSTVFTGQVNPENAKTEYFFEYAEERLGSLKALCPNGVRKEACEGVQVTSPLESHRYGKTAVTREALGLHSDTPYNYRLSAESEDAAKTKKLASIGEEGAPFATPPAPKPEALVGAPNAITTTSALISGSVSPNGQAATYSFELGVYTGDATQYGVAFSGSAGAGAEFIPEELLLTGLQPGTEYAYRIKIESGYGTARSSVMTFRTEGLPVVLAHPPTPIMLPIPPHGFPPPKLPGCKHGYKRDKHGSCVKIKKSKAKRKSKGHVQRKR